MKNTEAEVWGGDARGARHDSDALRKYLAETARPVRIAHKRQGD